MPQLPSAADYGLRTPSPSRGVSQADPNPMGRVLSGLGTDLSRMAEEEAQKLDEVAAQNALNRLEQEKMRMTYDPKDGFLNVQGTGILERPLLREIPEAFTKQIEAISATLKTPNQQALFRKHAATASTSLQRDLFRHVAVETEKAKSETAKATLELGQRGVENDPSRLEGFLDQAKKIVNSEAQRTNMSPEARKLMDESVTTDLVSRAVKGYLAGENPNTAAAQEVVRRYEDVLPKAFVEEARKNVSNRERNVIATELSESLFSAYRDGGMPLTKAGEVLATYGKDDEKLRAETRRLFFDRVQELNLEREEKKGVVLEKFIGNPTGKNWQAMQNSDEFRSLDSERKVAVTGYVKNYFEHEDMRRRGLLSEARAEESRKYNSPDAWATYYNLAGESEKLAKLTPNQVKSLYTEIGPEKVGHLLAEQARVVKYGASQKITPAIINAAIGNAPGLIGNEDSVKKKRAVVLGMVEENLSKWKDQNPGKMLTQQDEELVVGNVMRSYVQEGVGRFGGDVSTPVWEMSKKTSWYPVLRGSLPPLSVSKAVPPDFAKEMVAAYPNITTEQLHAMWNTQVKKTKGK
jgi:hypothetical protein